MPSLIAEAFARVAAERRDGVALAGLAGLPTRSFGDVAAAARETARALDSSRLPPAPCVVSATGNHPSFFSVFLAVLSADGALVLFDSADRADGLLAAAAAFGADAVVLPAEAADRAGLASTPLPDGLALVGVPPAPDAAWRHDPRAGPTVLKLTSGSSAAPRAVVASERHLAADARHVVRAMDIGPGDVSLAAIPLAHSYGLGNLVLPLLLQGSAIAVRDGFAPRQLRQDLDAAGVTVVPGVPFFYEHLRRHDLLPSLAGVRRLITAGAPIARDTVAAFHAAGLPLHSFYGTSETGGITFDDRADPREPPTVGRPLPGVRVTLAPWGDDADRGRVFVQGEAVAAGYAGHVEPDPIAPAFVDNGFLTGDLARFDGLELVLVGRVTRFINVAGRKVDPAEVEQVLRRAPHVLEAHVFGLPCDRRGEQVVACVRRAGDALSVADVRAFCAGALPAWKVPREIVVVDALPQDARGKVSRRELERLVTQARGGQVAAGGAAVDRRV